MAASVCVTVKHGKDRFSCVVDREFNRSIVARVVGAPDENITVICRGRKLQNRDPIAENSILLVLTHDKSELQDFEEVNAFVPLSLPSSSGAWVRQLRPYLPVTVYRWVAGVCGLCISLWLRFFGTPAPAAPTSSRGDTYYNARDGEVVDLVVELGTESPGPAADPSQQAEKVLVEWDIDGCGTLLLPAREERVGPAVGSVKQSVRSNGRTGTVQCTVSDRTGSAVKLFRFNEVD
eukprot:m.89197 g.89197  ORF g.89197 m.89197 type:complete len:235 (+) comp13647_c0_seq2:38-742(+)